MWGKTVATINFEQPGQKSVEFLLNIKVFVDDVARTKLVTQISLILLKRYSLYVVRLEMVVQEM